MGKKSSFFQYAKTQIKMEEQNKLQSPEASKGKQTLLGTNLDRADAAETVFFISLVSLANSSKIVSTEIFYRQKIKCVEFFF